MNNEEIARRLRKNHENTTLFEPSIGAEGLRAFVLGSNAKFELTNVKPAGVEDEEGQNWVKVDSIEQAVDIIYNFFDKQLKIIYD